ncbi:hypothetical protein HK096_010816 [Nowakowskiella sp. JEL0078]|nr:hypothetical protein HK096_010816 [Nowakowskiella sp. JEL0078]
MVTAEEILKNENIAVRDVADVLRKIEYIIEKGGDALHVISDFDMTITKYWVNGERNISTHSVLTKNIRLPEYVCNLFMKYYPIEISNSISIEEKTVAMVEWWEQAHKKLIDLNITEKDIAEIVAETPISFRDETSRLIRICCEGKIPLLVFSAGISDVILQILKQANLYTSNMDVISNKMHFNETTGFCDNFLPPLIHVFNKNEASIQGTNHVDSVKHRKCVILLGDSTGDLKMSHGFEKEMELTIGFLSHDVEQKIEIYKNAFDVVLLNDTSFDFVNQLISAVLE